MSPIRASRPFWGTFVEFYGEGVAEVPLANRATLGNMSPEFGSTAAIFPMDEVTVDYLRMTGRNEDQLALVEAYAKAQGMWHNPQREPKFSEYLELNLSDVVPSIAGPKRPQDRIALSDAKSAFRNDLHNYVGEEPAPAELTKLDKALEESFPASDSRRPTASHSIEDVSGVRVPKRVGTRWGSGRLYLDSANNFAVDLHTEVDDVVILAVLAAEFLTRWFN